MSTYRDNTSNHPAPPARGLPINPIAEALQAFFKAFGYMSMYPTGHPAVQQAVNHTARAFDHALAERQTLAITVARDHLICDDQKIDDSATGLSDLAALLHKMDVVAVEFHCDLTIDDLV
ncbi:MAG: hypothetical protein IID32_10200, partial [Planctomycetes bacterium]|nr:hypothetical protein [Planctomycetota bacterium]